MGCDPPSRIVAKRPSLRSAHIARVEQVSRASLRRRRGYFA